MRRAPSDNPVRDSRPSAAVAVGSFDVAIRAMPRRSPLSLPSWMTVTWVMLGSLLVWSYGVNNIPVPGIPAPAVDAVFGYVLFQGRHSWVPFTRTRLGRRLVIAIVCLDIWVLCRLALDFSGYGLTAVRDALFAFEIWGVLLGWGLAQRVGRAAVQRAFSIMFGLALFWFCFYPFPEQIASITPIVGIQRPEPLFAFTSIALVAAWAMLWFMTRRGVRARVATGIALGAVLIATSRGVLAGLVLAAVVLFVTSPMRRPTRALLRFGAIGIVALGIITVLPPLPGRLGAVTPSTFVDLIQSGLGQKTAVSSSYDDRQKFQDTTLKTIRETRFGYVLGAGLGRDLIGGFQDGALVRKPHNDFLEYFARLGIVGFIPWLAVWIMVFAELFKRGKSGDPLSRWGLAAFSISVLISYTQPFASFAYGGMVQWIVLGVVLGCPPPPHDVTEEPS